MIEPERGREGERAKERERIIEKGAMTLVSVETD